MAGLLDIFCRLRFAYLPDCCDGCRQVGGKIDKETSPNSKLDKDGEVGSKFKSSGEVGGKVEEKVTTLKCSR